MSQWYYNKDGQAHGPLKIEDMESRIKSGHKKVNVGKVTLTFKEALPLRRDRDAQDAKISETGAAAGEFD